jgi:glycosyltransferase involved in cell wall biosynthesis
MNTHRVLLIYVEPTPYILGLIEHLGARWQGELRVLFAGKNLSQSWGDLTTAVDIQMLPQGKSAQWRLLQDAFASRQYALVHLAGWSGAPAFKMALLLAAWHGVPSTVESDTPPPWQEPWYRVLLKRLCYPWLFSLPTHFFPGGRRQAAYLRQYGVAVSRITEARMTVDVKALMAWHAQIDTQRRQQLRDGFGCSPDTCLILYVGRLEPHKGLQELLDAVDLLDACPVPTRLLVVGSGSMSAALQRRAVMSNRVFCAGRLAGEVLLHAYAAADVLVLPSRFEPWGLVVNEAMAASLPVVVSERVGCADDLVVPGETGLVVPTENPEALAAGLRSLAEHPATRRSMGLQARTLISGWTLEHEAEIIVADWTRLVPSA